MWLQLIIVPLQLYISNCPSISEGKIGGSEVGQRWVRGSEVQRFGSKFREAREVSQGCLSEVIFRLEKEDCVTCPLYYEVRSQ